MLSSLVLAPLTLYVLYRWWDRKQRWQLLPPGPKGLPLLGNVLDMPKSSEWLTFHKWAKDFGTDIVYLNAAGRNILVIDTAEAAFELLERRSSLYSGRPRMPMIKEVVGYEWSFVNMDYGDDWRQHRRLMHHSFHPTAARRLFPHLERSTSNFLSNMLDRPNELIENLRKMAGQTILAVAYGIEAQQENDPYIKIVHRAVEPLNEASIPGAFLVDVFPWLKYVPAWMPGAEFKRKARVWKSYTVEMLEKPFEATKNMMAAGLCPPNFTSISLEMKDSGPKGYDDEVVKRTAGTMYSAGADTTVAVLTCCILGLLGRPDIVRQAQKDLDRVMESGQLPNFGRDEDTLPIISAIAKEAMRWKVITPVGVPHHLHVDDEYNGHIIPAGTMIIPNMWAMLHNEDVYPDPESFKPERFIKDGKFNKEVRDPAHAVWGFGRRICPGRYFAFPAVWTALASLLYTFDIEKAVDGAGKPIDPKPEDHIGVVCMPLPYPYRITPRSQDSVKLIRDTYTDKSSS